MFDWDDSVNFVRKFKYTLNVKACNSSFTTGINLAFPNYLVFNNFTYLLYALRNSNFSTMYSNNKILLQNNPTFIKSISYNYIYYRK